MGYLWKIRNQVVHEGLNPLGVLTRTLHLGTVDVLLVGEWLPLSENNARVVCGRATFLVALACSEAYVLWWSSLDIPANVTIEELTERGLTLEVIELELGLPSGWSASKEATAEDRLRRLRRYSQTAAKELVSRLQIDQPPVGLTPDNSLSKVIATRRKARHRYVSEHQVNPAG